MNASLSAPDQCESRDRVRQLRAELALVSEQWHLAQRQGRSEQVILLLRRKSALIRQLFEAQSALLLAYREEGLARQSETL